MSKVPNTRFHQEFFAKSGTEHDDMVARIVQDLPLIIEKAYAKPNVTFEGISKQKIGEIKGPHYWGADLRVSYKLVETRLERAQLANYAIESPVYNGTFLIGWIDILASFDYTFSSIYEKTRDYDTINPPVTDPNPYDPVLGKYAPLTDEEVNRRNKQLREECEKQLRELWASAKPSVVGEKKRTIDYIIEAKPELTDIGSIIRQVKTYCEYYRQALHKREIYDTWVKAILISHDEVPETYRPLFANENIAAVRLEQ